jgi:hypothetical protein
MTQLIKVNVGEAEFWIEPEETAVSGQMPIQKTSAVSDLLEKGIPFDLFSKLISSICQSLARTMNKIEDDLKPSKFSTEFGFKINGEGNVYLVKSGVEASLKVTVEWNS